MPYKDKDKQKQANREWVRQKRTEDKGTTNRQLLHDWAIGKGNNYQQGLGILAAQYNIIEGQADWGRETMRACGWKPARMHNYKPR